MPLRIGSRPSSSMGQSSMVSEVVPKNLRLTPVTAVDGQTAYNVDLPTSFFITSIDVLITGTGGSGTVAIEEAVSRLKVINDRGFVLADINTGNDLRDLGSLRSGIMPELTETTSSASRVHYPVHFNRFEEDQDYCIPAMLYNKLTLELTTADLIATTTFQGTPTILVTVNGFDANHSPASKKVLVTRFVQSHTTASQTLPVDLHLGNKIRRTSIFCTNGQTDLTLIELLENHGVGGKFRNRFDSMIYENQSKYGFATQKTDIVFADFASPKGEMGSVPADVLKKVQLELTEEAGSTVRIHQQNAVPATRTIA